MQFEVFIVPVKNATVETANLNRFLRGRRVLSVVKEFVNDGPNSCWTFCVEYLDGPVPEMKAGPKVDYKEVLTPEQFSRFSKLRDLRKEFADREAVPPYAVFTNEQLAQMVRLSAPNRSAVESISGVGDSKMAKYGEAFLKVLQADGELKA